MKEIFNNYKSSALILIGIVIGGICGVVFGESTEAVKPVGDLFLNLMFCTIVPLIFFSLSSAVSKTTEMARLGRILKNSVIVFAVTSILAGILAYVVCLFLNPLSGTDPSVYQSLITNEAETGEATSVGDIIVNLFTVSDFKLLFDKGALLPMVVFTLAFGIATSALGEKAKPIADFLNAGSEVIFKIVGYVMILAPVGLGCYFAYTVGQLGPQLLTGFVNSFLIYLVMTVIYYFGFFSIYAFISGKTAAVKIFWKNVIDPSLTAIATSSSAACIPVNLISTKKMGVPDDISETAVPLGANLHKDGSVMSSALKIVFLFAITGQAIATLESFAIVVAVSVVSALVIAGIPVGGATAEVLILSILGLDMNLLGLIMIISTIVDIPATLLNATGNTIAPMLVARFTEGKDWLKKQMT